MPMPFDVQAALRAMEPATSLEELMAAAERFVEQAAAAIPPGANPSEGLANLFGADDAAAVVEIAETVVADVEEETAAGHPIDEHAVQRVAHRTVVRMARRANRAKARISRVLRREAFRARAPRAPRRRRAPRRAVRLSAVSSAGDGPSPPAPAPIARDGHDDAPRARSVVALAAFPPLEVRR
jgi:hypothetical protein